MTRSKEKLYEHGAMFFAVVSMVGALTTAAGFGALWQGHKDQVHIEEAGGTAMAPDLQYDHDVNVGVVAAGGLGFAAGYTGFLILRGMSKARRNEQPGA